MKVLDISPYYLEKMVLTMGSTLIASKLPVASDGVVRPYGICELGDTGYNRYSGNQYSGNQYSGKLTLPTGEDGIKYYEVNFEVVGDELQGTSVTMAPPGINMRDDPEEVYNEKTGAIALGYVRWECNNDFGQVTLHNSGLYYITENLVEVSYGERGERGDVGPRGDISANTAIYKFGENGNLDTLYLPIIRNNVTGKYYTITYTVKDTIMRPVAGTKKEVANNNPDIPLTGVDYTKDKTIRIPRVLKNNKLYSAVLWSRGGGGKYKLVLTETIN